MGKKIIAIGAHYDDIEMGCAGTLKKHNDKGDDVYMIVTASDEFRTGDPKLRCSEQLDVLECFNMSDDKLLLFKSTDDYDGIVHTLDNMKPDLIYVQHEKDTHQAHRRANAIGQSVGRKKNIMTLFYSAGSSYEFSPTLFSLIDFNFKMRVLKCFPSQISKGVIRIDTMKKYNAYLASLIKEGDYYAEGFIIRKMVYEV